MALTTEEEGKVRTIIEAFNNGKRLSDLPDATGANPFDLICEVLEKGESKKAALAKMLPYLEEQCMYGVEFDTAVSSGKCKRIGNMGLHKTLPMHERMRGCLLDDNGKSNEYLSPLDWRSNTRDGSRGQVMVEIPDGYWRFETDGTKRRVKISEYPLPGYVYIPKRYVSAYEATVQRSTTKLCSVVNMTADYRGGNNTQEWDNTYRSLLGKPASNINRTNFRAYARKRKPSTKEWNCMTYGIRKQLFWLFAIEYATLNTQEAYNPALTAEGYRQGGLGAGVTNVDDTKWKDFNSHNPFIPCGYTDEFGNRTGVKEFTMPTEYNTVTTKVSVPRYRGIENPFGHLWQWADGINVMIQSEADGGLSKVFVTDNPEYFNDTNYNNMRHVGNEARTNGFVKEVIFGEGGEIIAYVVGGSSSTYLYDYHYTDIPKSGTVLRGVLFGGHAYDGAFAGFVCASSGSAPSHASSSIGSRLCFIPA